MAEGWDAYLQPGERILWEGAPQPGIRNRERLAFISLFGVPFFFFGLAGTGVGLQHIFWRGDVGIGLVTLALGLIFIVVGYTFAFGEWVEAAKAHRTTRYALSTRAAYVARQSRKRSLKVYPILPKTALEIDHCDGYDNVWFHARSEDGSEGGITTTRIGFEGIKDGTEVYRLMRSIQTGPT
ncbi:hypothetical protein [Tabrizicola sp.]|uniref:hypothetical protein n=1 Tax=Tabrizicola sp. TaxID=2005166 RepID=UPI003F352CE2